MTATQLFDTPPEDRSPKGIAQAVGRLISSGQLEVGTRLPPVRQLADELGVSPSTVGDSWRILQNHRAIITDGRRGTFVAGPRHGEVPGRSWQVPVDPGTYAIDLSTGTPDPALLPALGPILRRMELASSVTSYFDDPVLPALAEVLHEQWPFPPEALTVVDGAQDALDRLVMATVALGDVVVVEEPAFPPVLDMLEIAGAEVIGVPVDEHGMSVEGLANAMERDPTAVFLQPRSHNPTGAALSPNRAAALAKVLERSDVVVIEDDHSAAVSGVPIHSLGAHLPDQVALIRSFSKSHGPELRLAAIGGAAKAIAPVVRRRRVGPSWSSRILQQLLAEMLIDPETVAAVACAAETYVQRRARMACALADRGCPTPPGSGLNLWLPVADEQVALVSLAANGIGAAPGTPFTVDRQTVHHLRLTIGAVACGVDELADTVAKAATTRAWGVA